MRAVLDCNVYISAALSPAGAPARLVSEVLGGGVEVLVSPKLVAELRRALEYPKVRSRVSEADARELVARIEAAAEMVPDPPPSEALRSRDSADDYLLVLAQTGKAALVTGDRDLLTLAERLPVFSPSEFLQRLERG